MKYLFVFFLVMISIPAQAEVFAWKDPQYNIALTYPDDWMYQATEKSYARLHIVAPQGQDEAACRVIANNDNRFLYVPPQGQMQVSQFVQDEKSLQNLFEGYLQYANVRLVRYNDIAALGKGPASLAVAQYYKVTKDRQIPMQSLVFGGYVQGLETFFQCEAAANAWDKWQPVFMNMVKTFDLPPKTSPLPNGYYRDFMADGFVYFPAGRNKGVARY
tara:strand:- start:2038 stop:2688 length:651 start_codon:yes stop_codon:yes gene_type:complete